ncbi:MAG: hypothetical protein NXH86_16585 [Flavobacteriaceae bacterium]|jgi:hypothetical protein|uniref:hypothetical protein n=1 Tax=Flagellimonas sp. TaxID=2058762 RepID=UPI003BA85C9D|nr:hypothetical protein [Flavobacteriaceae bacterium]
MEKTLDRKIKAIWDFRGPSAAHTAEHYQIHLKEFAVVEKVPFEQIGVEQYSPSHSIVYMVITEQNVKKVRSLLRPHRGEIYTENP